MCKWTVQRAMIKLLNSSILKPVEIVQQSTGEIIIFLAINPTLCARGNRVEREVYELFAGD